MTHQDNTCPVGNYGSVIVNLNDQHAQNERLEGIGMTLRHLKTVIEAVAYDRIGEEEVEAVTHFAAQALDHVIEREFDPALKYSVDQTLAAAWNGEFKQNHADDTRRKED